MSGYSSFFSQGFSCRRQERQTAHADLAKQSQVPPLVKKRLGQSEVFSIVLITAVLIALVSAAYFWGIPLINKRTTAGTYTLATNFVNQLNDKILKVVNAGSGTEIIDIPLGVVRVVPHDATNQDNNSVLLEFFSDQPLALGTDVVYIGSTSFTDVGSGVGTYRESTPGVISLKADPQGSQFKVKLKLHYRELDTIAEPYIGYKIGLESGKPAGSNRIRITYKSVDSTPQGAYNGGDLIMTKVNIEVT